MIVLSIIISVPVVIFSMLIQFYIDLNLPRHQVNSKLSAHLMLLLTAIYLDDNILLG